MILKQFLPGGIENYKDLGSNFQIVYKEKSPNSFKLAMEAVHGKDVDQDFIEKSYAVIHHHHGSGSEVLYRAFTYELFSEGGAFFKDLSIENHSYPVER